MSEGSPDDSLREVARRAVGTRPRRAVTAGLVLVVVVVALAVVNAGRAPAPVPTAPLCFDEAGDARARLEAEAAGGGAAGIEGGRVLQQILRVSCPDQYGGLRVTEGVVVVYWTGDVTELTAILPSDRVNVEQVWFTEQQLQAAVDAAAREFGARGIRADMGVDVPGNTVEVGVTFGSFLSSSKALAAAADQVELAEAQEVARAQIHDRTLVFSLSTPD